MAGTPKFVTSRRALHAVAELVLAGPQHAQTGEISLRAVPGGFGTTHTPDLRVVGAEVVAGTTRVGIDGHTARTLATALGVVATSLSAVYSDGAGVGPHVLLEVDVEAATQVADAFAARA